MVLNIFLRRAAYYMLALSSTAAMGAYSYWLLHIRWEPLPGVVVAVLLLSSITILTAAYFDLGKYKATSASLFPLVALFPANLFYWLLFFVGQSIRYCRHGDVLNGITAGILLVLIGVSVVTLRMLSKRSDTMASSPGSTRRS